MRSVTPALKPPRLADVLPIAAPLATLAVVITWSYRDGGYPSTSWYPGGLLVGCLLAVQLLGGVVNLRRDVRTWAVAALAAFGGFQLVSIAWASSKGQAWDAGNRTLIYAFVLAMFACSRGLARRRAELALAVVCALAIVGLVTLHSAASNPAGAFVIDRLSSPTGYANATAALFLLPLWTAVALAADPARSPWFRGLALGSAATLAAVAYVPESRGAVYAFPLAAVVLLVVSPNRFRTTVALIVATAPTALFIHTLTRPFDATTVAVRAHATREAMIVAALAGVVAAAVGAGLSVADNAFGRPARPRRALRIAVPAIAVAAALILAATHSPANAAHRVWTSFKSPVESGGVGGSRLLGNLGSNRYDFWRVSLDLAKAHPIGGVGADNFGEAYLLHRRSGEEPQYPHSLEMSLLAETGAIGTVLFASFAGALGLALYRARRREPGAAALAAGAATSAFYWLLHGSVDWLWEFPALGGVALVLVGLAVAPPPAAVPAGGARSTRRLAGAVAVGLAALSFAPPWLAARQTARAAAVWQNDPSLAYDLLGQASTLNPLSDSPDVTRLTIAAERGDAPQMAASARRAIARDSHNWFSRLQLAVALAHQGQWAAAAEQGAAAHALNPSEPLVGEIRAAVREHRRLRLDVVDNAELGRLERLDPRLAN